MSTNQPIDPDTGHPVDPSAEETLPPGSIDEARRAAEEAGATDDVGPGASGEDLIMGEVLIDDDPETPQHR